MTVSKIQKQEAKRKISNSCPFGFFHIYLILFFGFSFAFFSSTYSFATGNTPKDSVLAVSRDNLQKLKSNPPEAYATAIRIEDDARRLKATEAEMWSLLAQCEFLGFNNEFSNLYQVANRFYNRAQKHELSTFQAVAKYYLYHSYYYNQMYEKALKQLDDGIALLENEDRDNTIAARAKRNLLTAYSNYYAAKKDYKHQIHYLQQIVETAADIKDTATRNEVYYIHYANLASAHFNILDLPNAQLFLEKSIQHRLQPNENVDFLNYMTQGKIAAHQKDYEMALSAYRKALYVDTGYVNSYNKIELYDYIVSMWNDMQMPDSAMYYSLQRDAFQSGVLKKKNEFLYDMATGNEAQIGPDGLMNYKILVLAICGVLIAVGWYFNQNKAAIANPPVVAMQNGAATVATAEYKMAAKASGYTNLINMLRENNPAFSAYFDKVFPDFTGNILEINGEINQSELEFCQLLKLKLSSKEIATFKFISPKTVQNKKYLLRKKMNIPKDIDIYHWFDNF